MAAIKVGVRGPLYSGGVTSSPPGIRCPARSNCSTITDPGESWTLTAEPESGYRAEGFEGPCESQTSTTCTFTTVAGSNGPFIATFSDGTTEDPELTIELETYAAEGGNADFTTFPPSAGVDPDEADETTVLGVTVRNDGSDPLDDVQVRGLSTRVVKSKCKGKDPFKPDSGGPLGLPGTLQPGASLGEQYYKLKEECAGSVDATVRATAAGPLEETEDIRIEVPDNAYITGKVTLAEAGFQQPMTPEDYGTLARNLRIRAEGKKKTLTGRLDTFGRYSIEVPNGALGRYELKTTGNKATEADPFRDVVKAVRGKSVKAIDFELGYACDVAPAGMDFTPTNGDLQEENFDFNLVYRCRSQRVLLNLIEYPPDTEPCVRSDGSTYRLTEGASSEGPILAVPFGVSERLDEGAFSFTLPTTIDEPGGPAGPPGPPLRVEGIFTGPRRGTIELTHPDCAWLNSEQSFVNGA